MTDRNYKTILHLYQTAAAQLQFLANIAANNAKKMSEEINTYGENKKMTEAEHQVGFSIIFLNKKQIQKTQTLMKEFIEKTNYELQKIDNGEGNEKLKGVFFMGNIPF